MKLILITSFVIVLLFVQGCNRSSTDMSPMDNLLDQTGVYSTQGILGFNSFKSFNDFLEKSSNLSDLDKSNLESKYGYISISSTYKKVGSVASQDIGLYYSGSMGSILNKDQMTIIDDNLYHFDSHQVEYISLKDVTVPQAILLLKQNSSLTNSAIHISKIEDASMSHVGSNKSARSSNGYTVTSPKLAVRDCCGTQYYYSTARLTAQAVYLSGRNKIITVSITLTPYYNITGNANISTSSGTTQRASGNLVVVPPPYTVNFPFNFDTGVLSGGGTQTVNIYTSSSLYDPSDAIRTSQISFDTGSGATFSANQGYYANYGGDLITTGTLTP